MTPTITKIIVVASWLLAHTVAVAQTSEDAAAIKKRIDDALKKANGAVAASAKQPMSGFNIDAIPTPKAPLKPGLNLEQMAQQYSDSVTIPVLNAKPQLLVFVSLSMPTSSLNKLMDDAARFGATLIIRGLVEHSITTTAGTVQKLIGTRQVAWNVDPDAFKRYQVTRVPAYVLVRAGGTQSECGDTQCLPQTEFVKLTGDVPIAYAVEQFAAAPGFAKEAERIGSRP